MKQKKYKCLNCKDSSISILDNSCDHEREDCLYRCLNCGETYFYVRSPRRPQGEIIPKGGKYSELTEAEDYSNENREIGGIWGFRDPETGEIWDTH